MSHTLHTHSRRHTTTWVLGLLSMCLLALFLALAFDYTQPMAVTVDGVRMRLRAGTLVSELQNSGAIASHTGRLMAVDGTVLNEVDGQRPRITRNGRPVTSGEMVFDGDVLTSVGGIDSTETTEAVREPIPITTTVLGSGSTLMLANAGSVGVRESVVGVVSGAVVSSQTITPAQPMVIYRVVPQPTGKLIALTFDDGPWPGQTNKILKILKAEHIHATFFMLGVRVKLAPGLARQVVAAGNQVGNHTLGHKSLTTISPKEMKRQIVGGADAIFKATGVHPMWLRPPYGAIDPQVWKESKRLHLHIGLWDIDPRDWSNPGVKHIGVVVKKNAKKGRVILLHDGGSDRKQTIKALPKMIRGLKKRGFIFVTMQELANAH